MSAKRTELAPVRQQMFDGMMSGNMDRLPVALKNLEIFPHEILKSVVYGHTKYEWDNQGSRDIEKDRAFGGWIAALSDHIVSMTMASALEDNEWFTTTELTTRMFRPVPNGIIHIEGKLVSRGRTSGFVEADWRDENGRHLVRVSAMKAIRQVEGNPLK